MALGSMMLTHSVRPGHTLLHSLRRCTSATACCASALLREAHIYMHPKQPFATPHPLPVQGKTTQLSVYTHTGHALSLDGGHLHAIHTKTGAPASGAHLAGEARLGGHVVEEGVLDAHSDIAPQLPEQHRIQEQGQAGKVALQHPDRPLQPC